MRAMVVLVMATCLLGCASAPLKGAPGLDVIVKADSNVIVPGTYGASQIQAATGCQVEAVRPLALDAFLFRLWPTTDAPDVKVCLRKLQSVPGVQYASPDEVMKTK